MKFSPATGTFPTPLRQIGKRRCEAVTDCEKYIELISRLVDGELSKEQEAELRAHIDVCPECRRVYDAFSAISDALGSDIAEVPEGLAKGVMYRIGKTQKTSKPRFFVFGRFTAVAACLV
ncbi:MAG: hypothetical protein EOM14_07380, partial [Clostridia bacterium]|nr:hypothetical protein [Clostridia bacterium]